MSDNLKKYESYLASLKEIKLLKEQIEEIKDIGSLKAISYSDTSKAGNNCGNIIESHLLKIEKLERIYRNLIDENIELLYDVERDLESIEDKEIKNILRCHYILGMSWIDTSIEIYGVASYQNARKRIMRYYKKEA